MDADRFRTLLLRADNVVKNAGDPADRARRAREALQEALEVAGDDERARGLVLRRLEALEGLGG